MSKKNSKNVKKKEELPSFLLNLSSQNLDRKSQLKDKSFDDAPVFIGECKNAQGILHPIVLGGLPYQQYSHTSDEYINPQLFLSKENVIDDAQKREKFHLKKKRKTEFIDRYPHRCPGVKKVFAPEIKVFTPDLGETSSEIESDTWREISFCRVKSTLLESSKPEVENVTLSDMKEKNRALLPYEQRMAHYHFPKEFITVKLVGPVIPASITITKIPSKRKRMSDFTFEAEEKSDKVKTGSKSPAKRETQKTAEEMEEVKVEEMVTEEETEVEETELEREADDGETEKPDENLEEKEEVDEEKMEERDKVDEEMQADKELENKASAVGEAIVAGEEEAVIADETENVEGDKEE